MKYIIFLKSISIIIFNLIKQIIKMMIAFQYKNDHFLFEDRKQTYNQFVNVQFFKMWKLRIQNIRFQKVEIEL